MKNKQHAALQNFKTLIHQRPELPAEGYRVNPKQLNSIPMPD